MKNLRKNLEKIWEQKSPQKKRELIHEMIDFSSAKQKTKILSHAEVDRMADYKLDYFATNYWQSGEGNKVIK
jgi:hypothetical protein